jgi:hypothetical protein
MSRYAIRLATLAACAAMVVAPVVTATESEASSPHVRHHHKQANLRLNNAWASEEFPPVAQARNWGSDACPGSARSFDCKIWPPLIDDDPDRRAGDGGP